MSIKQYVLLAAFAMLASACIADEDIDWRYRASQDGVTLSASPLSTAQRTAFYMARGFTESSIRPFAQACGFSFGMRNGGASTLNTRLADWRAISIDGREVRMRLPTEWDQQWARAQVPASARIAFRWAQFQAENTFESGDWIMGMATLEESPFGSFRLVARYHDEKGNHEIVLDKLACSHD